MLPMVRRSFLLAAREIRLHLRAFWRNPLLVLATVALPLALLPLLHSLNKNLRVPSFAINNVHERGVVVMTGVGSARTVRVLGDSISYDQYLGPALAAFGICMACMANLS